MNKHANINVVPSVDRILMSDTLRGNVPALESDGQVQDVEADNYVFVTAEKISNHERVAVVGILRGIELGLEPQVEMRLSIVHALDIIETPGLLFGGFELKTLDRVVNIPGPFKVKSARLFDIDTLAQMCTLGLHLVK